MIQTDETQEVVITENQSPQRVVRRTTRQVEPEARGAAPQKVYETKKTLFRFDQIIWYVLSLVEVLLVFRIILKALGANQFVGFTNFIYTITEPLAAPFRGILGIGITGNSVFEWTTIIASIVYLFIAWGLVYLLDLVYPISPKDVEQ